jgi:signal transduction histidine kinase
MNTKIKNIFYICLSIIIAGEIIACFYINKSFIQTEQNIIHNNINVFTSNMKPQFNLLLSRIQSILTRATSLFRVTCVDNIYITQSEFDDAIDLNNNPLSSIIDVIYWIPKIDYNNLLNYETYCSENIIPNCTIKEINITTDKIVPVRKRGYYFPLMMLTPSNVVNKNGLDILTGIDLNYGPTKILIDNALSNKNSTSSFRILFNTSFSIILNQLIFINNTYMHNATYVDLSYISGILMASLNIKNIFNTLLNLNTIINRNQIDIFVFDVTQDGISNNQSLNESLLYKENKPKYDNIWYSDEVIMTSYSTRDFYNVYGRNWSIFYIFSTNYTNQFYNKTTQYTIVYSIVGIFILCDIVVCSLFSMYANNIKIAALETEKRVSATKMLQYVNHELRNPLNVIDGMIDNTIDFVKKKNNKDVKQISTTPFDSKVSLSNSLSGTQDMLSKMAKFVEDNEDNKIIFERSEVQSMLSDMETAYGSCELMRHIINDILDIRKLEEGKMNLEQVEINLNELLNYMCKSILPKIKEKFDVQFYIDLDENIKKIHIYTDKNRLMQILLNFLHNAIKFTMKGSITLKITYVNDSVRFEVIDTGRGISQENQLKIFRPFQQVEKEDSSRYGGIGLGLYLCNMLIQLLNGQIGFESEIGKGSTFWIELPIGKNTEHTHHESKLINYIYDVNTSVDKSHRVVKKPSPPSVTKKSPKKNQLDDHLSLIPLEDLSAPKIQHNNLSHTVDINNTTTYHLPMSTFIGIQDKLIEKTIQDKLIEKMMLLEK